MITTNTTTNTTSKMMKKFVEVANSSDNLDKVKSYFSQVVGEFPSQNYFKSSLKRIFKRKNLLLVTYLLMM